MNEIKLSVVTISFNQSRFLEDCIRSVLAQKTPEIEYIVVDAGSTDGSRDIIEKYSREIDRVILEPDEGPADGLNKGFSAARGEIYYYINADDKVAPGAFDFALKYFNMNPGVDVVCGASWMIDEGGRRKARKRTSDRFDSTRYVAGICTVVQQATFFRGSAFRAVGGFNKENRVAWDGEILVDMALAGCAFQTVFRILGEFRIYGDTITGSSGYREKYRHYEQAVAEKLSKAGVQVLSGWRKSIARALYKLNFIRHLGYLMVR